MTHTYDWSKLDEGWELTPNYNPESVGLLRRQDGWAIPVEVLESWEPDSPKHAVSPTVDKFRKEAKAQLAKCRIDERVKEPKPTGYCAVHGEFFLICAGCYEHVARPAIERANRKHEATHGWRNPPSVYEEDKTNAEK